MAKVKVNTEALKKNGAAIGCGVVVLAAVVASFYPLSGKKEELQAQVQKSAGAQSQLEGLLNQPHPLPVLTADNSAAGQAEAKSLDAFPTQDVIKAVGDVVDAARKQSTAMLDAAVRINAHPLLVQGSLPAPSPAAKFAFRDAYANELEHVIPEQILNAGTPPADQDIQLAVQQEQARIQQTRLITVNGQPINQPEVAALQQQAAVDLPRKMREDVAKAHKVYIGTGVQVQNGPSPALAALTVLQPVMNPANPPDELNMWFAQVGVWIQEDVARAIAECNAQAKNVEDAPVKHLLSIQVPSAYVKDTPAGTPSSNDPGAAIPTVQAVSATGRVCNPMYDVIHFTVTMRVEAEQLPVVLATLGHNRLITPLEVNVTSFDNAAALGSGYYYGNKPVVEVSMKCEALQLRRWTVPYMPLAIKTYLGIAPAPGAPAAG